MLLLKCPKCKNKMKYQVMKGNLVGKSKRCVYCGHYITIKNAIVKNLD